MEIFYFRWVVILALVLACVSTLMVVVILMVVYHFRKQKEVSEYDLIRKRGVFAPAIIRSSKALAGRKMDGHELNISFDVDVQPEGRPAFTQTFTTWMRREKFIRDNASVGDAGQKMWVTYDPNTPSKMVFEYFEIDRELMEWEKRRNDFILLQKNNDPRRKSGVEALATVTSVEDLDLAFEWEPSKAMKLTLEVMPGSGPSFKSEAYAFIVKKSLDNYSAGKKIYVRYNPSAPEKVGVIRSAD